MNKRHHISILYITYIYIIFLFLFSCGKGPLYTALHDDFTNAANTIVAPQDDITNFTAIPLANQINLTWTNPSNIDFVGIQIQMSDDECPVNPSDGTTVYNSSGTSHDEISLNPDTTYYFTAFAYNSSGIYSTGVCVSATTTNLSSQDDVTGLTVTPVLYRIDLAWTNPVNTEFAGVIIQRTQGVCPTGPTDGTTVYNGTGTSYNDTGLIPGGTYYYAVYAYNTSIEYSTGVCANATRLTAYLEEKTWELVSNNGFDGSNAFIMSIGEFYNEYYVSQYKGSYGANIYKSATGGPGEWVIVNNPTSTYNPSQYGGGKFFKNYLYTVVFRQNGSCALIRSATGDFGPGNYDELTPNSFGTNLGYMYLEVFNDNLYAVMGSPTRIFRSADGINFTDVLSVPGFDNTYNGYGLVKAWNNALYVFTYNTTEGIELWKSQTGDDGSWIKNLNAGNGYGLGNAQFRPRGVDWFKGYIYAGAEISSLNRPNHMYRIGSDDSVVLANSGAGDPECYEFGTIVNYHDEFICASTRNTTYGPPDPATWTGVHCSTDGTNFTAMNPRQFGLGQNWIRGWMFFFDDHVYITVHYGATTAFLRSDLNTWFQ